MFKTTLQIIYPIDAGCEKVGGVETFTKHLIKNIPEDIRVEIIGISSPAMPLKTGIWHNIEFMGRDLSFFPVMKEEKPNKQALIPLNFRFSLALLRYKKEAVRKDSVLFFNRIEPYYFLKFAKNHKILFVHGNIKYFENNACDSRWKYLKHVYYTLEKYYIHDFASVFVVSKKGLEYYTSKYGNAASRFKFITTFYDEEVFNIRPGKNAGSVMKTVLFAGRLEAPKDPLLAINSFVDTLKKYKGIRMIIVGEGALKKTIRQYITDKKLSENIILQPFMSPVMLAELMNYSDVFLLTSVFEGMPSVVLEAMACGLPVVATDVGELGNMIKPSLNGELVKERNSFALADAISKVLTQEYDKKSIAKTVNSYSAKKVLSEIYAKIREVNEDIKSGNSK